MANDKTPDPAPTPAPDEPEVRTVAVLGTYDNGMVLVEDVGMLKAKAGVDVRPGNAVQIKRAGKDKDFVIDRLVS